MSRSAGTTTLILEQVAFVTVEQRGFRHALDPDEEDEAAVRKYERRGLSAATTLDGMVAGRFLLEPALGSAFLTALDAASPLVKDDRRSPSQRRERRFFTWTQRMAMVARDGDQCVWPWCRRPGSWSDGHHLVRWEDGGPTTVANGALPCEGHHILLHEGHWTLERLRGRYLARDRRGRVIDQEPHRRPRGMRPPPRRRE